jgi:putative nucleotidyltransferase with HDIG domain
VAVIESDDVLSARILRVANSVYFFRGHVADTIDAAVANMGLDELRSFLSATVLRSLVGLGPESAMRHSLWTHAIATGIASRLIARQVAGLNDGAAFLCGLLHDVGKLLILRKAPKHYEQIISLVASRQCTFFEAEEEILGLNHVDVGVWLAGNWNFPETVRAAISRHHEPWSYFHKPTYALVVKVADLVAHALSIGHVSGLRDLSRRALGELDGGFAKLGVKDVPPQDVLEQVAEIYQREHARYDA